MAELIDKVRLVLRTRFPGSVQELEQEGTDDRISGFLLWPGFEADEQLERQKRVNQVLREELTPDERQRVSMIFTLTPEEASVMREG
jgi:hypothetical protein